MPTKNINIDILLIFSLIAYLIINQKKKNGGKYVPIVECVFKLSPSNIEK